MQSFSIQSYVEKNREKIDESLVSLRIMKEIDNFLDYKKLSNKDLANSLGFSESYISQLMSGVKSVNVSFLNKFERAFSVKYGFNIYLEDEESNLHRLQEKNNFSLNITTVKVILLNKSQSHFSFTNNRKSAICMINEEVESL